MGFFSEDGLVTCTYHVPIMSPFFTTYVVTFYFTPSFPTHYAPLRAHVYVLLIKCIRSDHVRTNMSFFILLFTPLFLKKEDRKEIKKEKVY